MKKFFKTQFLASVTPIAMILLIAGPVNATVDIKKSQNDDRSYEYLELPNRLRVLLISDPDADKAAAALDINIGNGSDPVDRPGMAHFLEHMLFLGTEKYPDSSEYQSYIKSHGGGHNAYTAFDHTNYYFDIAADFLEPALDRFAQFFIAPLFDETLVERERQSVQSEYSSKRRSDGNRFWAARKRVFNQNHPASTFAVGSVKTLADREGSKIRDELIVFYEKHYSANLMTLVVFGREPLSQLKKWVIDKFSEVKDRQAASLQTSEPLYPEDRLPARLQIKPVKSQYRVNLTFPVPDPQTHYQKKPLYIVSHLLGHEGQGSLLSALKNEGWAEGLSAGAGMAFGDTASFDVSIQLTKDGFDNYQHVVTEVFRYIDLIKRQGNQPWVFEEQRKMLELEFRFQQQAEPIAMARGLADQLHRYPPSEILSGPYAMHSFDPPLILEYLNLLKPDNMLLTLVSPNVETDSVELRFSTPYKITSLPEEPLSQWRKPGTSELLAIPARNDFIPDALELLTGDDQTDRPVKRLALNGLELWHHNDQDFNSPRAAFYLSVRTPIVKKSIREAVLGTLFVDAINEKLNEFSYPASLAGLSYRLYRHQRGFSIRISGYNDKQFLLLERILRSIEDFEADEGTFNLVRNQFERKLKNQREDKPYNLAYDELYEVLLNPFWSDEARLEVLKSLTVTDLENFAEKALEEVNIVALAHGNVSDEDALALGLLTKKYILDQAEVSNVDSGQLVKLGPGKTHLREFDTDHSDAAVTYYLQGKERSVEARAMQYLLAQIIESEFYHQLRTVKQLGYAVFASSAAIMDVPGLAFTIQSPTASSPRLIDEIEGFLDGFPKRLVSMSEQELKEHKSGLLTRILQEDAKLTDRTDRYWLEIDRKNGVFDSQQRLADAVRAIEKQDVVGAYRELIDASTQKRLITLSAPVTGQEELGISLPKEALHIDDVSVFKLEQSYYPPL